MKVKDEARNYVQELDKWVRVCPDCGRKLEKKFLFITINCICGWIWKGDKKGEEG